MSGAWWDTAQQKVWIFLVFKVGCVVFWNVPELERNTVLRFLRPFSDDNYEE